MEIRKDTLVVPRALQNAVEAAAAEEHRSADDVLQDAVERYLRIKRGEKMFSYGEQRARELGLTEEDAHSMTDEYRQVLREEITQGVRSLRAGRTTDGESFMTQMDAELAALERQGR